MVERHSSPGNINDRTLPKCERDSRLWRPWLRC
jgi:hypothetical protein